MQGQGWKEAIAFTFAFKAGHALCIALCLTSCHQSQLLRVDLIPNSEITLLWFQAKPMTVCMDLQVPLAFSVHVRRTAKIFLGTKW